MKNFTVDNTNNASKEKHITKSGKLRKHGRLYQRLFGVSFILNLALIIAVIYLLVTSLQESPREDTISTKVIKPHPLSEKSPPGSFHDLTLSEIHSVLRYLYGKSELDLIPSKLVNLTSTFVYSVELLTPLKADVIKSDGERRREAKVIIYDGKRQMVDEYVVGPVTLNGSSMSIRRNERGPKYPVPYRIRQVAFSEMWGVFTLLMTHSTLHDIMKESFGATLFNCIDEHGNDRCLVAYKSYVPLVYSAERVLWIMFYYDLEFYSVYPIDFQVLVNVDSLDPAEWKLEKVWYANKMYDSFDGFVDKYKKDLIPKIKRSFPTLSYGSLKPNKSASHTSKLPPEAVELDGHRYDISGQTIRFLQWEFSWINALTKGPTLFDIKFNKERIIYELGLQDIVVLYTGDNPTMSRAAFADGFASLGGKSAGLVPGVDCPSRATFLNVTITTEDFHAGGVLPNAFCVFEHSLERPLRRHYSTVQGQGGLFYGGLVATTLIFRTIFVVNNYDYILDYMFYENGAIEVKIFPTGYVMTSFPFPDEMSHGFKVENNVNAPMHLHLFHFKVDIDIAGTENRYKTVNIGTEEFTPEVHSQRTANGQNQRYKFQETELQSESEALYRHDFSTPKYHVFYNDKTVNEFGEKKGYRISANGFVKNLLPVDSGFESAIPWSRYQMAVTKRKESEESSSSPYATLDASSPVVNFEDFIRDDDSIVDEDLVAWVTLGTHHIPSSEDIPNTATSGMTMSLMLTPFNYFNSDPSIYSQDSVRITPKVSTSPKQGLNIEHLFKNYDKTICIAPSNRFNNIDEDGSTIFFPYS